MKTPYKNRNPAAGVSSYEIVDDAIILDFADAKFRYVYTTVKPGAEHVATMKRLALSGKGLTTYVNKHVRENYAAKLSMKIEATPTEPASCAQAQQHKTRRSHAPQEGSAAHRPSAPIA